MIISVTFRREETLLRIKIRNKHCDRMEVYSCRIGGYCRIYEKKNTHTHTWEMMGSKISYRSATNRLYTLYT